jgi:hypothetical protein
MGNGDLLTVIEQDADPPHALKWSHFGTTERRRYNAIRGDVLVSTELSKELGRSSNGARVVQRMPLAPEPLSRSMDATLAGMAPTGFVWSGIEYVLGCACQAWWCRKK